MKTSFLSFITAFVLTQPSLFATTLPVGPYPFDSYAEFDSAFKRGAGSVQRDSGGYIYIRSGDFGSAVFDTSAVGSGGGGGLTGSDANNDLSDFTVLADISGSISSASLVGFYLRLDDTEANGYLASVQFSSADQVTFSLSEGASVSSDGTEIFSQSVSLVGLTLSSGSYYPLRVSANGGRFDFDFGDGAAAASFTDSTVSRSVGQVGFLLRHPDVRLDNFTVVPEPTTPMLLAAGACVAFMLRSVRRHGARSSNA